MDSKLREIRATIAYLEYASSRELKDVIARASDIARRLETKELTLNDNRRENE
jgi:hypothetical protein